MLELTADERRFRFKIDGVEYGVTALNAIPYDKARKFWAECKTDDAAVYWIADNIFEEECPEALRKLTSGQFLKLVQEYVKAGESSPGESQA